MMIMLIAGLICFGLVLWAALTVPLSEYDRLVDDEMQMEWLRNQKKE